jgi:ribosomal protein S18 acetylase RimI-like enzyme
LNEPHCVTQRPAAESDREFLRTLFMSTRERELAFFPGDASARTQLFNGQFSAQLESYRQNFPRANDSIIEIAGVAAGRIYVNRAPGRLHLIDISLLPEYRGRGIGSVLIQALLDEAAAAGGTVRLSVARSNPAQRLYQRLGFRTVDSDGIYLFQAAGNGEPASSSP